MLCGILQKPWMITEFLFLAVKRSSTTEQEGKNMNIKTLKREAKRQGYTLSERIDKEAGERLYLLTENTAEDESAPIVTNNKKMLAAFLFGGL